MKNIEYILYNHIFVNKRVFGKLKESIRVTMLPMYYTFLCHLTFIFCIHVHKYTSMMRAAKVLSIMKHWLDKTSVHKSGKSII